MIPNMCHSCSPLHERPANTNKEEYGGPTVPLEQVQRELAQKGEAVEVEHLSISQLLREEKESSRHSQIIPFAMVYPKGKLPRFPSTR